MLALDNAGERRMSAAFVTALDQEISALEEALNQDVRFVRLRELRRVRALYKDETADLPQPHATPKGSLTILPKPPIRRTSPERARATEAARLYLQNRTGPVPTADIYDHITSLGIALAGEEPRNNLSAMLSNSGLFQANGRAGWTLKPGIRVGDLGEDADQAADTDDNDDPNWVDARAEQDAIDRADRQGS